MANTRKIYEEVWAEDAYRGFCHGLQLWETRRDLLPEKFKTVVDLGCGTGRLVARLVSDGYDAYGVDIAKNAPDEFTLVPLGDRIWYQDLRRVLWRGVGPGGREKFDLGICCDVMEHIGERDVMAVLANIWLACDEVVFVIANHASVYLGHDLHPTRKAPEWWRDRMRAVDMASVVTYERLDRPGRSGVFVMKWKRR